LVSQIERGTKVEGGCSENRALRTIFGPKQDKATGEWRKLSNEELYDLYSSQNIIRAVKPRRLKWTGHVARMGERRSAYRVLMGKPERKRSLGRPRSKWEDTIKMDLKQLGWGSWTESTWLRTETSGWLL
jgi:hypothetical protein